MQESEALRQWWTSFTPSLDLEQLLPELLGLFDSMTSMEYGWAVVIDPDSEDFVLRAVRGVSGVTLGQRVPASLLAPFSEHSELLILPGMAADAPLREAGAGVDAFLIAESGATGVHTVICLPFHAGDRMVGVLGAGHSTTAADESLTTEPDVAWLNGMAGQMIHAVQNAYAHEMMGISYRQIVVSFAESIDSRDPDSRGHSKSVAHYASLIAQQMGLTDREIAVVEMAGFLHDVGRMSIPDEILRKQESLTPEEFAVVQAYPERGAQILTAIAGLEEVAEIVRYHCEKWDGSGYPDGLQGEAIPLGARILSVAHQFTAMISRRAYRRPLAVVNGAMNVLVEEAGKSLDKQVVDALLRVMGRGSE